MSEIPQTDVSRPSALPSASLLPRASQPTIDQNSEEYLDAIEEEWNKKVDVEVETLVDGMVDLVSLASVCISQHPEQMYRVGRMTWMSQVGDKDKFRVAQETFQAQCRAESMVRLDLFRHSEMDVLCKGRFEQPTLSCLSLTP
jgi:mediator of RNA polymerase II transcription subunit 22